MDKKEETITLEQFANLHRGKRFIVDVVDKKGITECTVFIERRTVSGTLISTFLDSTISGLASRKIVSIHTVENFGSPTINVAVLSDKHEVGEEEDEETDNG